MLISTVHRIAVSNGKWRPCRLCKHISGLCADASRKFAWSLTIKYAQIRERRISRVVANCRATRTWEETFSRAETARNKESTAAPAFSRDRLVWPNGCLDSRDISTAARRWKRSRVAVWVILRQDKHNGFKLTYTRKSHTLRLEFSEVPVTLYLYGRVVASFSSFFHI